MNVLILAAAQSYNDFEENGSPSCLFEINSQPLIELIFENCKSLGDVNFIVALRDEDIDKFHLDNIIRLLDFNSKLIKVTGPTSGAACTALLASTYIDSDEELLIINANEILCLDFSVVLKYFRDIALDAGVVCFSSIHPRYSYVRLNAEGLVLEAVEKRPISRNATAGFYWFAMGRDFVRAAKCMIRKDASVGGQFYIAPSLNELVLEQAKIGSYLIDSKLYHPLKTERQLTNSNYKT